jgi:hypothetical protein
MKILLICKKQKVIFYFQEKKKQNFTLNRSQSAAANVSDGNDA